MSRNKFISRVASGTLALSLLVSPVLADAQTLRNDVQGSFLVFTKFDIRGDTVTELRITNDGNNLLDNTGNYPDLKVKLNYVCPGVKFVNDRCAALDTTVTFTPHQTRVINVAEQNPPCNQGYVIAYAMNYRNVPVSYNHLYGSSTISSLRRLEGDNAIAINANPSEGTELGSGTPRQLRFGSDYAALPSTLYTDFRAVNGEPDRGSRLTLLTLDVLAGMQNPPAVAFIDFWNAAEVPFSTSHEFICWSDVQLDDIDLNFLEDNLGTTYGSMTLAAYGNCPIPGGCPPLTPYNAAVIGSISEYGDGVLNSRNLFHDETAKTSLYQPR